LRFEVPLAFLLKIPRPDRIARAERVVIKEVTY